jgi:hypothetical protein
MAGVISRSASDPASVRLSERQLPRKERRRANLVMRVRSVIPMRRFDDVDNTLGIQVEAKNRAVEVIESHRCLAAPARHFEENHVEAGLREAGQVGRGYKPRPHFKLLTAPE